jgi:hypothetical protein
MADETSTPTGDGGGHSTSAEPIQTPEPNADTDRGLEPAAEVEAAVKQPEPEAQPEPAAKTTRRFVFELKSFGTALKDVPGICRDNGLVFTERPIQHTVFIDSPQGDDLPSWFGGMPVKEIAPGTFPQSFDAAQPIPIIVTDSPEAHG